MKKVNFENYKHLAVKNARVMVSLIDVDYTKSKGGIQLSSTAKVTFKQGVIVALGQGHYLQDGSQIDLDYKLGDVIYFGDTGVDFKVRRGGEFENVTIVGVESIYYVDGTGHEMYEVENG
jgi:co-chaperonin GroES (HSP10)